MAVSCAAATSRKFGPFGLVRTRPRDRRKAGHGGRRRRPSSRPSGPSPSTTRSPCATSASSCADARAASSQALLDQAFLAGVGNIYRTRPCGDRSSIRCAPCRDPATCPTSGTSTRPSGVSCREPVERRGSSITTTTPRPTATARCRRSSTSTSGPASRAGAAAGPSSASSSARARRYSPPVVPIACPRHREAQGHAATSSRGTIAADVRLRSSAGPSSWRPGRAASEAPPRRKRPARRDPARAGPSQDTAGRAQPPRRAAA